MEGGANREWREGGRCRPREAVPKPTENGGREGGVGHDKQCRNQWRMEGGWERVVPAAGLGLGIDRSKRIMGSYAEKIKASLKSTLFANAFKCH